MYHTISLFISLAHKNFNYIIKRVDHNSAQHSYEGLEENAKRKKDILERGR